MKYKKFIIKNYRAITNPIEINLDKSSLIPIIGINESGKTTILQAIFAFDKFNDNLNNASHLKDTNNLYSTEKKASMITAIIEIKQEEFLSIINSMIKDKQYSVYKFNLNKYKDFKISNNTLSITRNLHTTAYIINEEEFKDRKLNNIICSLIIEKMPYIFYFDDFRDSIEDTIHIKKLQDGTLPGWLSILEELFKQTSKDYSVFKLKDYEPRQRKSILSKVQKKLNKTLTKEWQNFRLDESDALKIDINYGNGNNEHIKLEVVETDDDGDEHYFYIRDRSKGFYWFFNFVMKLEFNPKSIGPEENNSIYLLDEPGSYLHASAQTKLAKKLQQISKDNKVIYCTHSHYLLNPDIIPINSVRISDKDNFGNIELIKLADFKGDINDTKSAFQPILDSLQIKPIIYDLTSGQILISEGIYDYYCFNLFKGNMEFSVLPGVGADSLKFYISTMILCQKNYKVVWDNDNEGNNAYKQAKDFFGEKEAENFFLLKKDSKKVILQNLFDGDELKKLKQDLNLSINTSFNKVILNLYFSEIKEELVKNMPITANNFREIIKNIGFG